MLVEAIELLVGGRADTTVVRHGTDEARVDGRFITHDGDELVLSRVIARNGRSRAYLNGRLATVASLTEATAGLVDLHGQHAHQSLLSTSTQRAALDRFGDVDLAPLRAARARLTEIDAELAALGGDERARREIDLLRYQLEELESADVSDPGRTFGSMRKRRCSATRWHTERRGFGRRSRSPVVMRPVRSPMISPATGSAGPETPLPMRSERWKVASRTPQPRSVCTPS